jgi:hypothetical protein
MYNLSLFRILHQNFRSTALGRPGSTQVSTAPDQAFASHLASVQVYSLAGGKVFLAYQVRLFLGWEKPMYIGAEGDRKYSNTGSDR